MFAVPKMKFNLAELGCRPPRGFCMWLALRRRQVEVNGHAPTKLTEGTKEMETEPDLPVKRVNGRMWQRVRAAILGAGPEHSQT